MPFDSLPQTDLSLARLSIVLRDPSLWPTGFEWNYMMCSQCAMGLAYRLKTGETLVDGSNNGWISRRTRAAIDDARAMSTRAFRKIFWKLDQPFSPFTRSRRIRPEDVADAIDQYLAQKS